MGNTVFDVLNKQLGDQIESAQKHLTGGACQNHSEYREVVGLIRGLEVSVAAVTDLSRRYMEEDDD